MRQPGGGRVSWILDAGIIRANQYLSFTTRTSLFMQVVAVAWSCNQTRLRNRNGYKRNARQSRPLIVRTIRRTVLASTMRGPGAQYVSVRVNPPGRFDR